MHKKGLYGVMMVRVIRLKYETGYGKKVEGYFIKVWNRYIPVIINTESFLDIKDIEIISENDIEINLSGQVVDKDGKF